MEKRKIFISFRYADGVHIKDEMATKLSDYIINKSENQDRSNQSESVIQNYLYQKLSDTSVTIVILTPQALNYKRCNGKIDDWMYDELRYSLQDREGNKTNAIIALYSNEVENEIYIPTKHFCSMCQKEVSINRILNFDNLVRKNIFNIKPSYKYHKCENVYDNEKDSYIMLLSIDTFYKNPQEYINKALQNRINIKNFNLIKEM